MNLNFVKHILVKVVASVIFFLAAFLLLAYLKQDTIVNSQIESLNESYKGKISVGDVHLAPFNNFPYITLKVDEVKVYESKMVNAVPILDVADIYVGFNLWDILTGNYDIQSLLIEDGFFDVVLHSDGTTNLERALKTSNSNNDAAPIDIHLRKIELKNLDVHKREEAKDLDIETYIYWAKGGFNTRNEQIAAHIDSEFELNIIDKGDTTYFKHKHFEFHTDLTYDEKTGLLTFEPSGIIMEHGDFELEGTIDFHNEINYDMAIRGTKPSFDMFIAFAPLELIPVLERYENAGNIYFNATLHGPTTNGRLPFIDANFGASEAYLENSVVKKRIDEMGFSGHFTNGEQRNLSTMEFSLKDMSASLDKGKFSGSIIVKNFETPEIDMQLDANFDLDFVAGFLNLNEIENASGSIALKLKFHDIIDLEFPEKALSDLNQAYFAELDIKDLTFNSKELTYPFKDLDAHLVMNGKEAELDQFNLTLGNSNLLVTGTLSDLPAIVHHYSVPVNAHLEIKSDVLDVAELTNFSEEEKTGVDERVENLSLAFSFNALANAFTEFKHLPKGEFYIDELYADLKHYPHTLHDFHADVLVKDDDLKVVDFTGVIDSSDFHFNGLIRDYSFWMQDELNGDVEFDITLKSDLLRLEDLLAYKGENYVPKDYRQEEIDNLEVQMESKLQYSANRLSEIDIQLNKLEGKMHIHPLRFEDFSGRFHVEDKELTIQQLHGKMGKTEFDVDMQYYFGADTIADKTGNSFVLRSDFIDFDALSNYNLKQSQKEVTKLDSDARSLTDMSEHAEAFNIYRLPFTDMQFDIDVEHFIYHRLDLKNIKSQIRTTHNHYVYVDTISLDAAGGHIAMNGYFNGSDPEQIYLKPNLKINDVDLDKLLFKFENFGQESVVSENLHGQLNANIIGNIRVYPDMMADLDQSDVHLDVQVLNGRLENYEPVMILSDYFGDKDLTSIKFDTLQNQMDIANGKITIPNMTIESTLGHLDISGTQDMNNNIDYYVRIPLSLVKQAARNKLFGAKENKEQKEDEIIEVDPDKKVRYLNLNISGTFDDYQVKIRKAKN
jgi:hypothetical protein